MGARSPVNHMYVRHMVPQAIHGRGQVLMVDGMTLAGKFWETTPDGRVGIRVGRAK